MLVRSGGRVLRCHCPTTGRLGELDLRGIPCLLSRAKTKGRKTNFTVEAIAVVHASKSVRTWVGINQNAANRYIEHFLKSGQLRRIATGEVKREVKLGVSRIDFMVGRTFLEVKTPLISLPAPKGTRTVRRSRFNSFDRLIKHMSELSRSFKERRRAVMVMCYLYDAKRFKPPMPDKFNSRILDVARKAERSGVETWQVNLNVDENGVSLIRYFRNYLYVDPLSRSRFR